MNRLDGKSGIYLIDALRIGNPAAVADVLWHAVLPRPRAGPADRRASSCASCARTSSAPLDGLRGRGALARRAASTACSQARLPSGAHPDHHACIGLQIALLLGGAVLTETTFEWKGLGFPLSEYLSARDFVAVQGIVALLAVIVALTNFIVDIIAALIDPRVRY